MGTDAETVYKEARLILEDTDEYQRMARAINPYGDGKALKGYEASSIILNYRMKGGRVSA